MYSNGHNSNQTDLSHGELVYLPVASISASVSFTLGHLAFIQRLRTRGDVT